MDRTKIYYLQIWCVWRDVWRMIWSIIVHEFVWTVIKVTFASEWYGSSLDLGKVVDECTVWNLGEALILRILDAINVNTSSSYQFLTCQDTERFILADLSSITNKRAILNQSVLKTLQEQACPVISIIVFKNAIDDWNLLNAWCINSSTLIWLDQRE